MADDKKVLRRDFLKRDRLAAGARRRRCSPRRLRPRPPFPMRSKGYIVYDSRLCFGCQSCMYACSMTHEGAANPASRSRSSATPFLHQVPL